VRERELVTPRTNNLAAVPRKNIAAEHCASGLWP